MIGFSSRWLSSGPHLSESGHSDGEDRVRRVLDLDFPQIEIAHPLTREEMNVWCQSLRNGTQRVVAIRNQILTPSRWLEPNGSMGLRPSLAAVDESERRAAVEETIIHLDQCQQFEARCLILEGGRVNRDGVDRSRIHEAYAAKEWRHGGDFVRESVQTEAHQLIAARFAAGERPVDALLRSLDAILDRADSSGVAIALTNRRYLESVPTLTEFPRILGEFEGSPLRTWLDVGHAEYQSQLGWWDSTIAPSIFKNTLAGLTFTDGIGITDGLPPGEGWIQYQEFLGGVIDWEESGPPVPSILRCATDVEPERIFAGVENLKQRGFLGPPPPDVEIFPRIG